MFALPPDPYRALGLSKDAQNAEIKTAYRKLVLKCHPDKVQDPQLKAEKQAEFQAVHQAYELLIDDLQRDNYDEKVKYNEKYAELEREREKSKMSSSAPTSGRTPRTPSRSRAYYEPEIRTAEPRPSTYAKSGTPPSSRRFYEAGHTSSHSWEDDLGSSSRPYDETRRARKTASYEREQEREREWERERENEKEREKLERRRRREKESEDLAREREREREQRDRAKQDQKAAKEAEEAKDAKKKKERREKDKDKKKSDKERKRETEDKHRRKSPYVEDSDVEDATPHVFEKKSSNSRIPEDEETHTMTTDRERKNSANLEFAARYLERSGAKTANLSRSPTFQDGPSYSVKYVTPIAAPTPPPATASAHPPPPPPPQARDARDIDVEEGMPRRSSGRSGRTKPPDALRSSTKESRDKSSHRKSGRSASRDATARPNVVEVAPGVNRIPALQKSYSDPHRVVKLNRSYTENFAARPGPRPVPGMERQNTWQQGDDRGRGRGRHVHSLSEESEDDPHHHPSRRTQSPEPMVGTTQQRYAVDGGKTRRKGAAEAMPIPPRSHKVRHVAANTSSPRADPGAAGYYSEDYADAPVHAAFSSVKYSPVVREEEVAYSPLPRYSSSYTKDPYGTPVY